MKHFFAPSVRFALSSFPNSLSSVLICFSNDGDAMSKSSMYARTESHFRSPIIASMYLQKTAEAVFKPIGMRLYMKSPSGVRNAVNSFDCFVSGTFQNASFMSILLKYSLPLRLAKFSATAGREYASGWIVLFRAL